VQSAGAALRCWILQLPLLPRRGAGIPTARGRLLASVSNPSIHTSRLRFLGGLRRMFQLPWVQARSQSDPKLPPFSRPLRRGLRHSRVDLGSYCLFDVRAAQDRYWLVPQVLLALQFKWVGAAWFPKGLRSQGNGVEFLHFLPF
jgi:hypothetical protein